MTTKEKARKVYFLYSKYLYESFKRDDEEKVDKILTEIEKYLK